MEEFTITDINIEEQAKREYDMMIDILLSEGLFVLGNHKQLKGFWEDKEEVIMGRKCVIKGDRHIYLKYFKDNLEALK